MKKFKKSLKIICQAIWYLSVILLALTLIHVIGAKLHGQIPNIMGYSLLRISTGSMEPAIPTGTYILVKQTAAEEIHEGDIISFYSSDPLIQGMPYTHRVYGAPRQGADGISFTTKGDANMIPDSTPALSQSLIGRHVKNLDGLTAFADFCTTRGMLIIIIAMQVLCAVMMLISVETIKRKNALSDSREDSNET